MAVKTSTKPINVFDMENYSRGQGIFPDGPARFDAVRFGTFDFGRPGNDAICMILTGQPLNPDGTDAGDQRTQYYPCGQGLELLSPVRGETGTYSQIGLAANSEYDKLFGLSDFAIFMEHLKKAGYDMDGADNDITTLDGTLAEMGKYIKPAYTAKAAVRDDGKPGVQKPEAKDRPLVIVAKLLDEKTFGKGKPAAAKETSKANGKEKVAAKPKEVGDDPEEIIEAYVDEKLTDDREGEPALNFKIGIAQYAKTLGKDAEVARAAQAGLKESFDAVLASHGWTLKNNKLAKEA